MAMTSRSARRGIGALSKQTGCNIETIRYYERIGLMPPAPRNEGGHRLYPGPCRRLRPRGPVSNRKERLTFP
jgi:hypothetical protein